MLTQQRTLACDLRLRPEKQMRPGTPPSFENISYVRPFPGRSLRDDGKYRLVAVVVFLVLFLDLGAQVRVRDAEAVPVDVEAVAQRVALVAESVHALCRAYHVSE